MAYWRGGEHTAAHIAAALSGLRNVHDQATIPFRVVVHQGRVTFSGRTALGEESILGPELNFAFHMEKVASKLGVPFCLSSPAAFILKSHLENVQEIEGEFELKGFRQKHRFFSWD